MEEYGRGVLGGLTVEMAGPLHQLEGMKSTDPAHTVMNSQTMNTTCRGLEVGGTIRNGVAQHRMHQARGP